MKQNVLLSIILFLLAMFIVFTDFGPEGKVYDCGMAEWHPDIPNEVREECRKLRREFYEQEKSQHKTIST